MTKTIVHSKHFYNTDKYESEQREIIAWKKHYMI